MFLIINTRLSLSKIEVIYTIDVVDILAQILFHCYVEDILRCQQGRDELLLGDLKQTQCFEKGPWGRVKFL